MSMRDWIWPQQALNDTPSIRAGMSLEMELKKRREGVKLIWEVGSGLNLKHNPTLGTAAVYFHRFYMFHSFQDFQRELTALGCLFLAGKVEETPKKGKAVCKVATEKFPHIYRIGDRQRTLLDDVMGLERVLLQTLKFDLQVSLPYSYVHAYAQKLGLPREETKDRIQKTWTFLNDSQSTTLCVAFEPQVIAVALIYLAGKLNTSDTQEQTVWWNDLIANLSFELLDNICHKILDFYTVSREEVGEMLTPQPPY